MRFVSAFCGLISSTIIPYVSVIPAGKFPSGIKKMVLVPDGIILPTPCDSRKISFVNEFSQMTLVRPLIRCLHSSDAPVFGKWLYLLDDAPKYLSLVLQGAALLAPLLLFALYHYTGVLFTVGHTCLLCSGHVGVASLVPFIFWFIFTLLLMIVELSGMDWVVYVIRPWIPHLDPPLKARPSYIPTLEV